MSSATHRHSPICVAASVCILAVASTAGCSHPGAAGPAVAAEPPAPPPRVRVITAQLKPWPQVVRVQGSLLADEQAIIGSKLPGRVQRVHVDLGSVVKRGAPLVTLDRREFELRVRQAEAQLRQACAAIGRTPDDDELTIDIEASPAVLLEGALVDEAKAAVARADRLRPTNAITDAEYETIVAQLKTAEARYDTAVNSVSERVSLIGVRRAELALAEQQLDDAVVTAPFDALVEAKQVSPGAYVQAGQPVAALVRVDRLRFTAGVPERRAGRVAVGQPIAILLTGRDEPITAAVSRVSPMVVLTSRSVLIEADVDNPGFALQAGLFAEAEITVDPEAAALVVPAEAVSQFAGVQKVWVVAGGAARQTTVQTGRRDGQRVEIVAGLKPGDVVAATAADGREGPVTALVGDEST